MDLTQNKTSLILINMHQIINLMNENKVPAKKKKKKSFVHVRIFPWIMGVSM